MTVPDTIIIHPYPGCGPSGSLLYWLQSSCTNCFFAGTDRGCQIYNFNPDQVLPESMLICIHYFVQEDTNKCIYNFITVSCKAGATQTLACNIISHNIKHHRGIYICKTALQDECFAGDFGNSYYISNCFERLQYWWASSCLRHNDPTLTDWIDVVRQGDAHRFALRHALDSFITLSRFPHWPCHRTTGIHHVTFRNNLGHDQISLSRFLWQFLRKCQRETNCFIAGNPQGTNVQRVLLFEISIQELLLHRDGLQCRQASTSWRSSEMWLRTSFWTDQD